MDIDQIRGIIASHGSNIKVDANTTLSLKQAQWVYEYIDLTPSKPVVKKRGTDKSKKVTSYNIFNNYAPVYIAKADTSVDFESKDTIKANKSSSSKKGNSSDDRRKLTKDNRTTQKKVIVVKTKKVTTKISSKSIRELRELLYPPKPSKKKKKNKKKATEIDFMDNSPAANRARVAKFSTSRRPLSTENSVSGIIYTPMGGQNKSY